MSEYLKPLGFLQMYGSQMRNLVVGDMSIRHLGSQVHQWGAAMQLIACNCRYVCRNFGAFEAAYIFQDTQLDFWSDHRILVEMFETANSEIHLSGRL